ncbi:MAG TPA: LysR substrate-binding domain-containing protein [Beijerinckiaceae bacterium]|jgi:DNA-binding transcriptional LysR family regulator
MPHRLNLEIDLLRAFVEVADARSFSRAGEILLRNQSTVSLQIKRLEDVVGHRLLDRTRRSVRVTPRGETFLADARRLIALNDEMVARVREPHLSGAVRLGAPEDFATVHLPGVLARFSEAYPGVTLEVACDLTLNLLDRFRAGAFDLVLVKREPASGGSGVRVWREPLVWVAGDRELPPDDELLPLVVSPDPCVYRKRACEALEAAGRRFRVAYVCGSLAGSQAAVRSGLGVTVLPKEMAPPGLRVLTGGRLPELEDTEIALIGDAPLSPPAERLRDHIVRSLEQGRAA